MHIRTPLGLYDGPSAPEGLAPYAGSAIPGPLGTGTDDASSRSAAASESRPAEVGRRADVSASFALGSDTYRLLRLDAEWRQGLDEVRVPPQEAIAIIERAARQHQRNRDVVHVFETAASQLAGLHEDGVFVLLWKQPHYERGIGSVAQTAPAATPSALTPPVPHERPPSIDEPSMGAMQATVLRDAAALGVPFCEECARAAAERGSTAA